MGKGSWSLLDQALFAISNFALNIILARWLEKTDYGAFTVGYTVFLLIGVVFNGLLVEPMLVFGAGRYKKSTRAYLSNLIHLHWKWGWMGCAILVGFVSIFYFRGTSFGSLLALAITGGFILYQWLLRRACYVDFRPRLAAEGGVIYLGSMILGVWTLNITGFLTAINGIIVMAASSFLAGQWIQHRMVRGLPQDESMVEPQEIIKSHWDYGRWAVLVNILSWAPSNIYLLILPIWKGEAASAELKAAFNLILPVQQLLAAAGPLLLPALVRVRHSEGFFRKVLCYSGVIAIPPLLWTVFLWFFGDMASDIFYAGKYSGDEATLLFLGLQTTLGAVVMVIAGALRAMERPRLVAFGYFGSTVLCFSVGLPLTAKFGIVGATAGMLISMVVNSFILFAIFVQQRKLMAVHSQ